MAAPLDFIECAYQHDDGEIVWIERRELFMSTRNLSSILDRKRGR